MPLPGASRNCKSEAPVVSNARKSPKLKTPVVLEPPKNSRIKVLVATKVLNPRDFVRIQTLPGVAKEGKVLARSRTVYRTSEPSREQVFWENYRRRQKQFTQGHFTPTGKPYRELGDIAFIEPKKLTLYSLGQLAQDTVKSSVQEISPEEVAEVAAIKSSSDPESDSAEPVKSLSPFTEAGKELKTLSKALARSRHHINSVKRGGEYFHILHQESLDRENTPESDHQVQGMRWRPAFQLPICSSDVEESEEELNICSLTEGNHLRKSRKMKKNMTLHNFTPVHTSILISNPAGAKSELLFRQLCAMHWLLEASTQESNSPIHSILACWNPKDPGGCKKTLKETEEENLAAYMWELFVTNTKKVTQVTHEKASKDFHKEDVAVKPEVLRVLPGVQKKYRANIPSTNDQESIISGKQMPGRQSFHISSFLKGKSNFSADMRQKFTTVREEAAFCLHDTLENLERTQEERCRAKFEALKQLTSFRRDMERVRQVGSKAKREDEEDEVDWFPLLLARLPESVKSDHYVQKILKKLEKYYNTPDLKIDPDTFLQALDDLQVWELCSPEIAAAVEFVRENIVQMPEEDFSEWFQTRLAPAEHNPPAFDQTA
ncbi:coiled-coil domain-containing protein 60 [Phaethornis superciliosus]